MLMARPPTRSTLFPYTTLFRSRSVFRAQCREAGNVARRAEALPRRTKHGIQHIMKDRKSTRLNSSHSSISYAVFCLKKITSATGDNCHRNDECDVMTIHNADMM